MTKRRITPLLAVAIGLYLGCGPRLANRSPTPDEAPERFARAVVEAEDVRRRNQEAEAQFYRRLGRRDVDVPDASPEPLPNPEDSEIAHASTGAGNP